MREVVIVGAARTPIGSFQGELAPLKAPELGKVAIAEALKRAGAAPGDIDEVYMGCVLSAGIGQAPARQASIFAGLPKEVPCTTVSKVCGSGLKAVMLGAQAIMSGEADVIVAGGMESMSNVPYYLPTARGGMRMGNQTVVDGMIHDGLWDVYNNFHMGTAAELCARERKIDRAAQDAYAVESFKRALAAQKSGAFKDEIVGVEVPQRKGPPKRVELDEGPARGDIEKIPTLKAAFQKDGTVTAGNASTINDGAAALIVCAADVAQKRGWKPLARITAMAQAAQAPEWFTTAPAVSIDRALKKAGVARGDIDLYEINEAFAVVAIANNQLLELDPKKVNVHGGAVALGHPIGASGARILVTLLYALSSQGKKRGVASLCIGGGEAVAMVVEPSMQVQKIGIIGTGQMGGGIAQVAAQSGIDVVLVDAQRDWADRGRKKIDAALDKLVQKGKLKAEDRIAAMSRISVADSYAGFESCDVVVEAATENQELKKKIFEELDKAVKPGAILASNTSSISITLLGAQTKRPEKVIGMHFMNPVPVMKLVEIVRGLATDDPTYQTILELGRRFGKQLVTAKDIPGFIVNRLLIPFLNEACFALQESLGSIEDIDQGVKLGLNHPMGPFELADLIGLDTCLAISEVLHAELGDDKYRPAPLLRQYVAAGWLGRKSGRGFYKY